MGPFSLSLSKMGQNFWGTILILWNGEGKSGNMFATLHLLYTAHFLEMTTAGRTDAIWR